MRTFNEVYSIHGVNGVYTLEYIQQHNIPIKRVAREDGVASPVGSKVSRDYVNIIQADGTKKKAYTYGEKMWSYDEAERDAYREQRTAEYETLKEHNRLMKEIMSHFEGKNNEELKKILAEM